MPNKARGEISLELGGKSYTLRPEFGVVAEIEDVLTSNLFKVGLRLEQVDFTALELLGIVAAFLGASGHDVDAEAIKVAIAEEGVFKIVAVLTEFCRNYAFGGGKKKKAAAKPSKKTTRNPETSSAAS